MLIPSICQAPGEAAQLAGAVVEGDREDLLDAHDLPSTVLQGRKRLV